MSEQDPIPTPGGAVSGRRGRLALAVFAILAIVILYYAARIIAPFVTPILFGAILATFSHRMYRRLTRKLKGRKHLAATIMLIGITVVVVIPAWILIAMLFQQATSLFQAMQTTDVTAVLQRLNLAGRLEAFERFIPGFDASSVKPEQMIVLAVRRIPAFVAAYGGQFLAGFANVILGFLLMLLATYYFYVEGEDLMRELEYLSPLPDAYDRQIFNKFTGVIDATFRGQLLTALAQGSITGIGLAIAGIPAPIFWGAVAALASLIPMAGAALVWLPAAGYLLLHAGFTGGGYWRGIFLVIWGVAVVSTIDNLIRPWAMRSGTKMPAIVLLFAILGGIQVFGLVGLVVGPLVFALLVTVVDIYKDFFRTSLEEQNVSVR